MKNKIVLLDEDEKILDRIRYGVKGEKIVISLSLLFLFFMFSFLINSGLKNTNEMTNLFLISMILYSLFNYLLINTFIHFISLSEDDRDYYSSILVPFILVEPLFFLDLKIFSFFKDIDWTFIPINFIIPFILLFLSYSYIKKNSALKMISSKTSSIINWIFILIIAIYITIILQSFQYPQNTIYKLFFKKSIILFIICIILFLRFLLKSRKYFSKSINLTKKAKEPEHGDLVYFRGKYRLLNEIKNEMSFFIYRYTEKLFFYTIIDSKKRSFDIYNDPSKKNYNIWPYISPGDEIEFLGKFIKLKIDGKDINYIKLFRLNNLSREANKKIKANLFKDLFYELSVSYKKIIYLIKNKFKKDSETFKKLQKIKFKS